MIGDRYERLFGYTYRQLVSDLKNEMSRGKDAEITASVLLFKRFNESFYYIGAEINPLMRPDEISPEVLLKLYTKGKMSLSPKSLWYLGAYFCSNFGHFQVGVVFDENDKLAAANASTFALTFPKFKELKQEWREWTRTHQGIFRESPPPREYDQVCCQSFLLTHFLLTLMPVPMTDEKISNSASDIYHLIMHGKQPQSENIDEGTARFKIDKDVRYRWRYMEDRRPFGQLFNLVEFALIQPLSSKKKEEFLEQLYETDLRKGIAPKVLNFPTEEMTALAKPMFYQGEFLGAIYVARPFGQSGFDESDWNCFSNIIQSLQVEKRLGEARTDVAPIAILRKEDPDANLPSPLRVLKLMHTFTSAAGAILVYESNEGLFSYENYSQGAEMRIRQRSDTENVRKMIERVVSKDPYESRAQWLFDGDANFDVFRSINPNKHRPASSVMLVLPIYGSEGRISYFILFFDEQKRFVELYRDDSSTYKDDRSEDGSQAQTAQCNTNIAWDIYAARMQNIIERLIDLDIEHKKRLEAELYYEKVVLQDLSLFTPHTMKNSFGPQVLRPLQKAKEEAKEDAVRRRIDKVIDYINRFQKQVSNISKAWRSVGNDSLTHDNFTAICEEIRKTYSIPSSKFDVQVENPDDLRISIHADVLSFLLEQLISNALEATANISEEQRAYRISWESINDKVRISVWNAGSFFPLLIIKGLGRAPLEKVRRGHSGLGFYLMELALTRYKAYKSDGQSRHFQVVSKPNDGVKISFTLPAGAKRDTWKN